MSASTRFEFREAEIGDVLDGCAFIEYCGNLYEYIGNNDDGWIILSDVNNGDDIQIGYERLLRNFDFQVVY